MRLFAAQPVLVHVVTSVLSLDIGGVGATAYDAFGVLDPWNKKLQLPQLKRSLPDARNIVFLTGDAAASEGDVFAFTARIYLRQPIFFQIWRLVGETGQKKKFKLIAQREVMPSVTEELHQHEDVRLTCYVLFCLLSSVQCNTLHGTEYKTTCGVCLCVCVRARTGFGGQISRKRLEIETWYQWTTNSKWPMANRLVT